MTGVQPRFGSEAGGTRLTMFGEGFPVDQYAATPEVFIGAAGPCVVESYSSSAEHLVCVTSAGLEENGPADVTVVVSGTVSTLAGAFHFYTWATRSVQAVWPQAGPPDSSIKLGGTKWQLGKKSSDFEAVTVGGVRCELADDEDEDGTFEHIVHNRVSVSCALPADGAVAVGNAPIALRLAAATEGVAKAYDPAQAELTFVVHPEVRGVSLSAGSEAGSTLVTLTGAFGDDVDNVAVEINIRPRSISPRGWSCVAPEPLAPWRALRRQRFGRTSPRAVAASRSMCGVRTRSIR